MAVVPSSLHFHGPCKYLNDTRNAINTTELAYRRPMRVDPKHHGRLETRGACTLNLFNTYTILNLWKEIHGKKTYIYTYIYIYNVCSGSKFCQCGGTPPMVWVSPSQSTLHGRSLDHARDIIQHAPCIIHHISHTIQHTRRVMLTLPLVCTCVLHLLLVCSLCYMWLPTIWGGPPSLCDTGTYIPYMLSVQNKCEMGTRHHSKAPVAFRKATLKMRIQPSSQAVQRHLLHCVKVTVRMKFLGKRP